MNQDPQPDTMPATTRRHPPIWQELVIELFFRPRQFFADQVTLWKTRYVVAVCWVYGLATAMGELDEQLVKAELNERRAAVLDFLEPLMQSWTLYWTYVVAYGVLCGLFLWWIGGWWYRIRLMWSGAREPDPRLSRIVYVYASFVYAAPMVIYAVYTTIHYPNYRQAYDTEIWGPLALLIFLFWSLYTSYAGVRTLFDVSRWRARTWFVILPGLFYLFAFGAVFLLFWFLPELQGIQG